MDNDWVRLVFDKEFPCETMQRWPGIDWEKRPPRMLQDLSTEPLGPVALQTARQSEPRRLDRLRDVHLAWSNFFIAGDRCASIYDDPRTAVAGIVDWPGLSDTAGIQRRGEDFVVLRSRVQNAEHISGETMFASSNEPHNWGMWLLYVLPVVFHFAEHRHVYNKLLVYAAHPNMQALLWLLGLRRPT